MSAPAPAWSAARVLERLAARGEAAAVLEISGEGVRETSAAALARRAEAMAAALAEAGVGPGEAVAIHAANGPDWIAAGLALGRIGAVLAPLDAALPRAEARRIAAEMGVRALLVDDAGEDGAADGGAEDEAEGGPRTLALGALGEGARAGPAPEAEAEAGPETPLAMFRTSGTTGPPKTFTLPARAIGFNVAAVARSDLVREGDRVLLPLPMHHVFPWIVGVLVCLEIGAPLVLPEGIDGPRIAAALKRGAPTVAVGVPRLWEALLAAIRARLGRLGRAALDAVARLPPGAAERVGRVVFAPVRRAAAPRLRLLVSGGARLRPEIAAGLGALGWDVRAGYGLSETAAIFAGELEAKRAGAEGRPLPGCELRIEDPGEDGTGEILVRGPNVFDGYRDDPERNARAFDADGFFRTGDLGRVDADGFLHVTGRAKEVIVLSGGDNLFPEEVERAYAAAEEVAEIAVLERDGALHALVVPEMAAIEAAGTRDPKRAVKLALDLVARDLPSSRRLSGLRLTLRPLPRTRLGKLRRFKLPERYEAAGEDGAGGAAEPPTPEERAWIEESPRAEAWRALEAARPGRSFGLDSHLALDLGLDSFAWLNLALEIERRTGVRLSAEEVADLSTVRDLLERVSDAPAADPQARQAEDAARLEAAKRRWLAPRSAAERALGAAVIRLVTGLVRGLHRLEVEGAAGLPEAGAVLICPNHVSDLDPVALAAALPKAVRGRSVWVADRVRVFGHPVWRRLCRALRVFPVDETAPRDAVALAVEVLERGEAQVWFPEGWRSADGRLLPFQAGVGHVILAARAPVVPVFIEGTREVWPRDRALPRLGGRLRVIFGAPVPAEALAPEDAEAPGAAAETADALRRRLGGLAREAAGADVL